MKKLGRIFLTIIIIFTFLVNILQSFVAVEIVRWHLKKQGYVGKKSMPSSPVGVVGAAGVVRLYTHSCVRFKVPAFDVTERLSLAGKAYTVCSEGEGTGFAVTKDYIASAGHVLMPSSKGIFYGYAAYLLAFLSKGRALPGYLDNGFSSDLLAAGRRLGYSRPGSTFYKKVLKQIADRLSEDSFTLAKHKVWATLGASVTCTPTGRCNSFYHKVVQVIPVDGYVPKANFNWKIGAPTTGGVLPDLAVGKLTERLGVTPLQLGDSRYIDVSERLILVGFSPLVDSSLPDGVILPHVQEGTLYTSEYSPYFMFSDFLIVKMPGFPGESGSPVLNSKGKVVGICALGEVEGILSSEDEVMMAVKVSLLKELLDKHGIKYNHSSSSEVLLRSLQTSSKHSRNKLEQFIRFEPAYYSELLGHYFSVREDRPR